MYAYLLACLLTVRGVAHRAAPLQPSVPRATPHCRPQQARHPPRSRRRGSHEGGKSFSHQVSKQALSKVDIPLERWRGGMPTYLLAYLPTHLPTYLLTCLPTSFHTYLPTSLPTYRDEAMDEVHRGSQSISKGPPPSPSPITNHRSPITDHRSPITLTLTLALTLNLTLHPTPTPTATAPLPLTFHSRPRPRPRPYLALALTPTLHPRPHLRCAAPPHAPSPHAPATPHTKRPHLSRSYPSRVSEGRACGS